jgi:hypothetical protein
MSENRFRWPLGALACLVLIASESSAANLLINPGFEDPITSDGPPFVGFWEAFNGGSASSVRDTVMPRNGAGHLSLNITGDNTFAGAFQDVEGLIPGQLMNFTVWHKTLSLPYNLITEARIEWRKTGQAAEVSRTPNVTIPPVDVYLPTSVIAAVPAGADTARVVYAIQSFTNTGLPDLGTVYVDDASLDVVPEPTTIGLLGFGTLCFGALARRNRGR